MKVAGVVAEYNPIHNGHIYHLNKTREISMADFLVVVMSGDFTQRGQPAILDKWQRAELAVKCGADLVLELPFAYACNSAEFFAKGAVQILDGLGCVDYISFGSESGNIGSLNDIADFLICEPEEYKKALKFFLKQGMNFPKARELALEKNKQDFKVLKEANNILAVEYIKNIKKYRINITPVTVKREGKYNDIQLSGSFASAMAIRSAAEENDFENIKRYVPFVVYESLKNNKLVNEREKSYFNLIQSKILTMNTDEVKEIFSVSEGLENKIKKEVRYADKLDFLSKLIKSKRYTKTAIDRMLIQILIGLKEDFFEEQLYGRVLALNEKGGKLLKYIKKAELAKIPIITNINKNEKNKLLEYDIIASDIYNLAFGKKLYDNSDYVKKPYIKKTDYF